MVTPATDPSLSPLPPVPGPVDTSGPPRTADDTARRLVAAATEVFAEKGYDRAGVAEIARRAGLTTGAIYSRYSGKAELLAAAVQDSVPEQFERLFAQSVQTGRATDLLQAVGAYLVTRDDDECGANSLLLEAVVAARRDPEVAVVVRRALAARKARWSDLIEAGKAGGTITEDVDTEALVHFTHAVGLGFLFYDAMAVEHPAPAPWESLIAKLVASLTPSAPAADPPPEDPQQVTGVPHGQ
jgi:AcrR family transcriptional regulator